jgi:hypothetical protein
LTSRAERPNPASREHVVKRAVDGAVVNFPSVAAAVHYGLAVLHAIAERDTGLIVAERTEFRVGFNLVDVIVEDNYPS